MKVFDIERSVVPALVIAATTAAVIVLAVSLPLYALRAPLWLVVIMLLLFAGFLPVYFSMRYMIEENGLILRAWPFKAVIGYKDIKSVELVPGKRYLKLRISGISTYGFYFGKFSTVDGMADVYAGKIKDLVVIKTERKTYAVAPKDIDGFISCIKEKLQ
ncbi:MAG: PH domain-containing protein [Elusimicrobiota bacterium]